MSERKDIVSICTICVFLGFLIYTSVMNWENLLLHIEEEQKNDEGDIKTMISTIEEKYLDTFEDKNEYITINGMISNFFGIRKLNNVVKLDNGHLAMTQTAVETEKFATNLIKLNNDLKSKGIDLMYVQAPSKINKYDQKLPTYILDYSNSNVDELLEGIKGSVDYIDVREEMYNAGVSQYDYFFKTDHHWTPEGAFWAFENSVAPILSERYDFQISEEFLDINNYEIEVYSDWFLGSTGKRVGTAFAGVDDISIITPKFDTSYEFEVPSRTIYRTGSFSEAMFDYSKIEEKDYFSKNPYAVYTGGDFPLNTIKNNNIVEGKKVLLVRDSFACAFAPFLSLVCEELEIIDLRYFSDNTLEEYIDIMQPDIVIFLYNQSSISEKMFEFE